MFVASETSDSWLLQARNNDWEIDSREIHLRKNIGMGNHAEVWGGLLNGTVPVAVKMIKSEEDTVESDFLREASVMRTLRHPKLVQLFGVYICTKELLLNFYIIAEFMKHDSLLDFLHKCIGQKSLYLYQLINMAGQIVGK